MDMAFLDTPVSACGAALQRHLLAQNSAASHRKGNAPGWTCFSTL